MESVILFYFYETISECKLTLILFVASSGSAEDDWSETMPSSDSWFDSCNNASASVKCTDEDISKLDAGDAEDWLFGFEGTVHGGVL